MKVGTDHAFGWRSFFDFGNDAGLSRCNLAAQAGFEAADGGACFFIAFHFVTQAGQAAVFLCSGDFISFDVEDFIEDIGHDVLLP
ncbi:hypothetical protein D3C81_2113280 [compost metagenome]